MCRNYQLHKGENLCSKFTHSFTQCKLIISCFESCPELGNIKTERSGHTLEETTGKGGDRKYENSSISLTSESQAFESKQLKENSPNVSQKRTPVSSQRAPSKAGTKDSPRSGHCDAAEAEKDPRVPGARGTSDASTATQTPGGSPSGTVRQRFPCESLLSATLHVRAEHRGLLSAPLDVAAHTLFPRSSCYNGTAGCRKLRGRRASGPQSTGGC